MTQHPIHVPASTRAVKSGSEPFHHGGKHTDVNLLAFWQWGASDLVGNALRGQLAEYLVAMDLGVTDSGYLEWNACDLVTKSGTKVEVKSSAYLQSWPMKELSKISFDIAPKQGWDAVTNEWLPEKCRHADVYVFCLLDHKDPETVDPMNLDQWTFHVLPTKILDDMDEKQQRLSLSRLSELGAVEVGFGGIGRAIDAIPVDQITI